jgi:hypothetical protein
MVPFSVSGPVLACSLIHIPHSSVEIIIFMFRAKYMSLVVLGAEYLLSLTVSDSDPVAFLTLLKDLSADGNPNELFPVFVFSERLVGFVSCFLDILFRLVEVVEIVGDARFTIYAARTPLLFFRHGQE